MLRVALLQLLLLTCWSSSNARGVYKLIPHQGANILIPHVSQQSAPLPYSFAYVADGPDGSSSHRQTGSASGSVSGSYGLKIKDGRSRQVDYTADAGGFKAHVNTNEPGTKSENPAEVSFKSSAPQSAPAGDYIAPIGKHVMSYHNGLGAADGAPAAYSFGYVAGSSEGSSSHRESGDGSGNVQGSYSMKIKDGRSRQVDYTADAAGFKAKINTNELGTKSGSSADAHFISTAPQEPAIAPAIYAGAPIGASGIMQVSQSFGAGGESAPAPYSFSYSAEGMDGGSSRQEHSDGAGNVRGTYSLKVKDGRSRKVDYTADAAGFKARVNTNEPGTKNDSPADVSFYSSAPQLEPAIAAHSPAVPGLGIPAPFPAAGTGAAAVTYRGNIGGSEGAPSPYSFGYTSMGKDGSSSHQESSDGSGNVRGSYSLTVKDGRSRQVDYTADSGGFKAKVNTNEPGTKSESPAEVSFYSSAPVEPSKDTVVIPGSVPYAIPSGGAAVSFHAGLPAGEGAPPYSFGYDAQGIDGSSTHKESSDGSGRVSGTYSLSTKDGRRRKVDYTAGAEGFKANVNTNEPGTKSDSPAATQFYSSAPQPVLAAGAPMAAPASFLSSGGAPAPISYQITPGGEGGPSPYSFSYAADSAGGSSSHQETGDGSGRVSGSYSLSFKDGRRRKVDYTADTAGFKAQVDTNEPGTKSHNPAEVSFHSSAPQPAPIDVAAPAIIGLPAGGAAISYQSGIAAVQGAPVPYSFGYAVDGPEGGQSHQETGDASGRVSGSYSLAVKDGRRRKVDYTADVGGFKASINTNEPGTKSDNPAEVSFHSSAALPIGDHSIPSPLYQTIIHGPRPLTAEEKRWAKSI